MSISWFKVAVAVVARTILHQSRYIGHGLGETQINFKPFNILKIVNNIQKYAKKIIKKLAKENL